MCIDVVKTTAVTATATTLILTLPTNVVLCDGAIYKICICQPYTNTSGNPLKMKITAGAETDFVLGCSPHYLYSDQPYLGTCKTVSCTRTILIVKYASDSKLFQYVGKNPIGCPCMEYSLIPVEAEAVTPVTP